METRIRRWQPQWFLDPVTRLPNRTLFLNRLQAALAKTPAEPARMRHRVAVFVVDVYEYAFIKERYGRRAALALLREVAGRLERAVGPEDTVARFADGVFALLREVTPGGMSVQTTAERLREVMTEAFVLATEGGGFGGPLGAGAGGVPQLALRLSPRFGVVSAPVHGVVSSTEMLALVRYAVEIQIHDRRGGVREDPGSSCFYVELLEPAFTDVAKR